MKKEMVWFVARCGNPTHESRGATRANDHADPAFPTSFSDKLVEEHREFYAKENERRIKSGNKMLLPTPLSVKLVELTSQVLAVRKVKHDAASVHLLAPFSFNSK